MCNLLDMRTRSHSTIWKWIDLRNLPVRQIALRSGLARQTIYNVADNPGKGHIASLHKIATALDLTVPILLCDPDFVTLDERPTMAVPVYNSFEPGDSKVSAAGQSVQFAADLVTSDRQFAFRLTEDVLDGYKPGDVFLINPECPSVRPGEIVLATVAGEAASLYRYEMEGDRPYLRQDRGSPGAGESSEVLILGVAVALERRRDQL